uniref:ABC transmembrane type-1 domain-containing protein n=1 Tax=Timema shepardi TaxID=629360 RepID=A0A7R9ARD2_TIMSH|nr:unnamed protein product [Timema shepardi]
MSLRMMIVAAAYFILAEENEVFDLKDPDEILASRHKEEELIEMLVEAGLEMKTLADFLPLNMSTEFSDKILNWRLDKVIQNLSLGKKHCPTIAHQMCQAVYCYMSVARGSHLLRALRRIPPLYSLGWRPRADNLLAVFKNWGDATKGCKISIIRSFLLLFILLSLILLLFILLSLILLLLFILSLILLLFGILSLIILLLFILSLILLLIFILSLILLLFILLSLILLLFVILSLILLLLFILSLILLLLFILSLILLLFFILSLILLLLFMLSLILLLFVILSLILLLLFILSLILLLFFILFILPLILLLLTIMTSFPIPLFTHVNPI